MTSSHIQTIAQELSITEKQVLACAALLDEGATVPFISRYRKEATGSLDEVAVAAIRDRLAQLRELDKRRETILTSLMPFWIIRLWTGVAIIAGFLCLAVNMALTARAPSVSFRIPKRVSVCE